ncbi:hypothetical protein [Streptomyces mirabilis]|uniref:hypothetical protein n=1 Tax=Streptomyces mirabilis TaxID=68239 RepID=UPI0033A53C6A
MFVGGAFAADQAVRLLLGSGQLVVAGGLPAVLPGAAVSADQGAVEEDHDPAAAGGLLQRPVQARGPGGQQLHDFLHPAADGGLPDTVAAGHVGQTLVVAQDGEHDDGLPAGFGLAPGRAHLVPAAGVSGRRRG